MQALKTITKCHPGRQCFGKIKRFHTLIAQQYNLFILVAPTITKQTEKTVTVERNGTLKLEVSFTGSPVPTMTCTKDTEVIKPDSRTQINEEKNTVTFTMKNVTKTDSGKYKINLHNEYGDVFADFTVKVLGE